MADEYLNTIGSDYPAAGEGLISLMRMRFESYQESTWCISSTDICTILIPIGIITN